MWWFKPTEEERAAGARWVRCDLGLHRGTNGLQELEIYKEIADMRSSVDELVRTEMRAVVEMLVEAQSLTGAEQGKYLLSRFDRIASIWRQTESVPAAKRSREPGGS